MQKEDSLKRLYGSLYMLPKGHTIIKNREEQSVIWIKRVGGRQGGEGLKKTVYTDVALTTNPHQTSLPFSGDRQGSVVGVELYCHVSRN